MKIKQIKGFGHLGQGKKRYYQSLIERMSHNQNIHFG
jgi:hypothetical protein